MENQSTPIYWGQKPSALNGRVNEGVQMGEDSLYELLGEKAYLGL